MATRRELVAIYATGLEFAGAKEKRLALGTDEAVALAKELSDQELRFPEARKWIGVMQALAEIPEPTAFDDKLIYYKQVSDASARFWDSFEGQEVAGVEIIRRR